MDVTYLISAHVRPEALRICLSSLRYQTVKGHLVVCDNHPERLNEAEASIAHAAYFPTGIHGAKGCYESSMLALRGHIPIHGDWLGFPNDDSFYVDEYTQLMLQAANDHGWQFVYCDMLYDRRRNGKWEVLSAAPGTGSIDKTNFLVQRQVFERIGGWPEAQNDWRDGALAERLVRERIPHGKAPYGAMVVHM